VDHEVRPRDLDRLDAKRPPQASLDARDLRALAHHRRDAVEHDARTGRRPEQQGDADQHRDPEDRDAEHRTDEPAPFHQKAIVTEKENRTLWSRSA
jgi:hypothetical protein